MTGVQTCALPIFWKRKRTNSHSCRQASHFRCFDGIDLKKDEGNTIERTDGPCLNRESNRRRLEREKFEKTDARSSFDWSMRTSLKEWIKIRLDGRINHPGTDDEHILQRKERTSIDQQTTDPCFDDGRARRGGEKIVQIDVRFVSPRDTSYNGRQIRSAWTTATFDLATLRCWNRGDATTRLDWKQRIIDWSIRRKPTNRKRRKVDLYWMTADLWFADESLHEKGKERLRTIDAFILNDVVKTNNRANKREMPEWVKSDDEDDRRRRSTSEWHSSPWEL